MPTVSISKKELEISIEKSLTFDQLLDLCFEFGLEVEVGTADENEEGNEDSKENGNHQNDDDDDVTYKIEVPANRYDLLCVEGISQALKCYLSPSPTPLPIAKPMKMAPDAKKYKIIVETETKQVRPYVVGCILRNIDLSSPSVFKSFMNLQDKLHQNICKKRSLVAIGTHDLDSMKGNVIRYRALPPQEISFVPLNESQPMTAKVLMEKYQEHPTLKYYLHIIKDKPRYPIIYDEECVLSMPPIINSERTRIKYSTKNVFIQCTATDRRKINIVLNTLVNMYSTHCTPSFQYQEVDVQYTLPGQASPQTKTYPDFSTKILQVDHKSANTLMGLDSQKNESISTTQMTNSLKRMGYKLLQHNQNSFKIQMNSLRSDIMHQCDVIQDLAISYGYTKLPIKIPKTQTIGKQLSMSKFQKQLRGQIAMQGFTQCLTMALLSIKQSFDDMRMPPDCPERHQAVTIANPKTKEFEMVRQSLIPCLLKILKKNKALKLPVQIFQISDVVFKDDSADTGARNGRKLAVIVADSVSRFELINGVMDHIMKRIGIKFGDQGYKKINSSHPSYLKGMCNQIILKGGKCAGIMGVLHPDVVKKYSLTLPISCMELDMEVLISAFLGE